MKENYKPNKRLNQLCFNNSGQTTVSHSRTSTMSRRQPSLLPSGQDDDFPAMNRGVTYKAKI